MWSFDVWLIIWLFLIVIIANRRIRDWLYIQKIKEAKNTTYNDEFILSHLNLLISQVLDNYVIFNINIDENIYYISSDMQTDMINAISDKVSKRISPTLYDELSLLYHPDEVGAIIGELIYMAVQSFAIDFNRAKATDKRTPQTQSLEKN